MKRLSSLSGYLFLAAAMTVAASGATFFGSCSSASNSTGLSASLACPSFNSTRGALRGVGIDFSGGIGTASASDDSDSSTQAMIGGAPSSFDASTLGGFSGGISLSVWAPSAPLSNSTGGTTASSSSSSDSSANSTPTASTLASNIGGGVSVFTLPIATDSNGSSAWSSSSGMYPAMYAWYHPFVSAPEPLTPPATNLTLGPWVPDPALIPEPGTAWMTLSGLIALAFVLRRRAARQ